MLNNTSGLWSRGQLESVNHCPACGGNAPASKVFNRRDNEGAMPDHWSMSQCTDCQSIWLNPRPDPLSLPRAYDNYYTHNINSDDLPKNGVKGIAWRLVHGYLNNRFNMNLKPSTGWGYTLFTLIEPWRLKLDYYNRHLTPRNVGKPGKLLDIGCGNGAFLSRAAEMGWQAKGCEIDPKAVSACHSIGLDVLEGDAFCPELKEQSFDVITMSHVIEHVHDQQALLQRTYDLLRPGGWLWLATPNPQSIGKKISGTAWHALHPPYHLCITSQTILIDWLKDKGFTTIHHVRRGSHVRNVWNASQFIARQERIPRLSSASLLCWRIISDCLSTISPKWGEETVLLARKPV